MSGIRIVMVLLPMVACGTPTAEEPAADCAVEAPSSDALLIDAIAPSPDAERAIGYSVRLGDDDSLFVDQSMLRRGDTGWETFAEISAFATRGDLVFSRAAGTSVPDRIEAHRSTTTGLERVHFILAAESHYVMGAALDEATLVFGEYTLGDDSAVPSRLRVFDPWNATIEEATVIDQDSLYATALLDISGDWIVKGGHQFAGLETLRRGPDGGWESTQRLRGLGASVQSVDLEGDVIAVGGGGLDGDGAGLVLLFHHVGERWDQVQELRATDHGPTRPPDERLGDGFGRSVHLAGDRLAVTAAFTEFCDARPEQRGAVLLYRREGDRWALEQVIRPPSRQATESFGWSADFDGSTLVVGDPHSDLGSSVRVERDATGLVLLYDVSR